MKKIIMFFVFALFIGANVANAQTEQTENTTLFGNVINWVVGIGIPGILAILFGVWKKGPTLIGKIASGIISILDELGNVLIQVSEARMSVRNEFDKLKAYAADGSYSKKELEDLVNGLESSMKEIDDIPKSLKSLKDKFKEVIQTFKK